MLSKKLASFEEAFNILNNKYFNNKLAKSIITISPTAHLYGHFTCSKVWEGAKGAYHEINLGAETINRPLEEVIATVLHEMVHQHCHENEIQDTSRGSTYHNKRFKQEAEKRGLIITYDKRIGWSLTKPNDELKALVKKGTFKECEKELHRKASLKGLSGKGKNGTSSSRKYVCPSCNMSVRATKEVNIVCGDCTKTLEVS